MKWNNGKEKAKFEREQANLRKEYLAVGMTEKQIRAMRSFDEKFFNERRREAEHTQELDIHAFDDEFGEDELKNALLEKFLDKLSKTDTHFQNERFGWIEQIEDEPLCKLLKELSNEDKELLTELFADGLTQQKIADNFGLNQSNISRKLARLKKIIKRFYQIA